LHPFEKNIWPVVLWFKGHSSEHMYFIFIFMCTYPSQFDQIQEKRNFDPN
jgi:hypothetical protein